MRRLTPLLITLLATTLLGAALAEGDPATEPIAGLLAGSSITCSTAWPSSVTGCWWEKRILTFGDFEVAIALDAAITLNTRDWYTSPMLSLAWYGETASIWVEVALPPDAIPIPRLGRSDWARIGFSYRWPSH